MAENRQAFFSPPTLGMSVGALVEGIHAQPRSQPCVYTKIAAAPDFLTQQYIALLGLHQPGKAFQPSKEGRPVDAAGAEVRIEQIGRDDRQATIIGGRSGHAQPMIAATSSMIDATSVITMGTVGASLAAARFTISPRSRTASRSG